VPPDRGHVPGKPTWATKPKRRGVKLEEPFAKIKVTILKQTVIL